MKMQSIFLGDRFEMRAGGWLSVVGYSGRHSISVLFEDTGYTTTASSQHLRSGVVKDYLRPSVCGTGFIGLGVHKAYIGRKATWAYTKWLNMLKRCYSDKYHAEKPTYAKCEASTSWHNFQEFTGWAEKQVGFGNRNWALDKDVIVRGNKTYSEDSCCFLPLEVNSVLLKCEAGRGNYVIGVTYDKRVRAYFAQCSVNGSNVCLGEFRTESEAHEAYKLAKEQQIKAVANKWKDRIDPRAYDALMAYEVLITD